MKRIQALLLTLLLLVPAMAQDEVVVGLVTDMEQEPIIGATVQEVDADKRVYASTVSDFNGQFSLQVKSRKHQLKVSYVGFKTQMLNIAPSMKIVLEEATTIQEVVVKGNRMHNDGTMPINSREISGAVQSISTKAFEGLSVSSIDDALQGRVAGLDIVNASGDLGAGSSMRIRGTGSINSNSTPLIVLNDIPYESHVDATFDYANATSEQFANLLSINPEDIEEITVLKDGASAAIYGSRGANGVIMIKTKRGVKGPPRVQYLYKFSAAQQPKGRNMLNGDDYTMLMKQAYFNPRQDKAAANIPEFNYDPMYPEYENFNNNTDWVDEVTQYGFTHDNTVNVTGGGDKARYRVSLGYYNQSGTIIEQHLDRISTLMNLDYQVSDRLKFSTEFSLTHTKNKQNYESLLDIAYKKMPNVGIYRQDESGRDTGEFYNIPLSSSLDDSQKYLYNPVALARLAKNDETSIRIMPTLRLQYDILDPNKTRLRYSGYVQFDIENKKQDKLLPREVSARNWDDDAINRVYGREAESLNIQTKHDLLFQPQLGDRHSLMLYAAWELTTGNSQYQEFQKANMPNGIHNPTQDGREQLMGSERGQWHSMAYMGRVHYAYLGRYILDATVRRDGSTRFGPGNRWGTFPAVSAKWIISDEKWMEWSNSWLDLFGIRAGYGKTGRMPDYEYLHYARYTSKWSDGNDGNNYIDISTMQPSTIRLSNLKWETNTSYNAGFDLNLFGYKYNLDFNVFHEINDDLLFKDQEIPSSTGFNTIAYVNGGKMTKDGWELNFYTSKMLKKGDWTFDVNFNLSNYTSKVKELLPSILQSYNKEFDYKNGSYLTRVQEGNAFGSIYGFRYKGVYQWSDYVEGREGTCPVMRDAGGNVVTDAQGTPQPMYFAYGTTNYKFRGGDAIYEDVNHDGTIDELDIVYLGNCNPKLYGGFGFTVRWKRLSMNAFFSFRTGNKIVNYARMYSENMYTNDNQSIATNWRWRKEGDATDMPRALYQYGYNWLGSDRYVEDGSFLRFKYLTFNYEFDPKVTKSLGIHQLNAYLTLNNLCVWTRYSGVDPEISPNSLGIAEDHSNTPRSQYFTFGLTVSL